MKNFKLILLSISLTSLIACNGKPKEEPKEEVYINGRSVAYNDFMSDSTDMPKRRSYIDSGKKEKAIYDATDTIPFGGLQILILDVEKKELENIGINSRADIRMNGGRTIGVNIHVSITNKSNIKLEIPFVSFIKKGEQMPFQAVSRMFMPDKTKNLQEKNLIIDPGKTVKGVYLITAIDNLSIIRFTYKEKTEDERLNRLAEANGGGYMGIITDEYDGWSAKVDLKEILNNTQ